MTKLSKLFISDWSFLVLIIYIINIVFVIFFNPFKIVTDFTKSFIFMSILTGFLNMFIVSNLSKNLLKVIPILFLFYGIIYTIVYFFVFTTWPFFIIMTLFNIILIIGLLSIIYKVFEFLFPTMFSFHSKNKKLNLSLLLIKHLIFYIPCLYIDLIEFVKDQYKITTKSVWIILLIEVIIFTLYVSLPKLYKRYYHVNGYLVKKDPIYLNKVTNLGSFQNINPAVKSNNITNLNYTYAISCWLWINTQPESTDSDSISILNYGNVLNINFNKNKLEFWASSDSSSNSSSNSNMLNNESLIYELKNIPYQKWNNIILNYDGGTLDIFINNILVSSNINITPIMYYNSVTAGAINGINGGIKDIIYYNKVLSKNDIYSIYKIG